MVVVVLVVEGAAVAVVVVVDSKLDGIGIRHCDFIFYYYNYLRIGVFSFVSFCDSFLSLVYPMAG